jgi:hypothetical protein
MLPLSPVLKTKAAGMRLDEKRAAANREIFFCAPQRLVESDQSYPHR